MTVTCENTLYIRTFLEKKKGKETEPFFVQLNSLMRKPVTLSKLDELYDSIITLLEKEMSLSYDEHIIDFHRKVFLEWENHLSSSGEEDRRFNFLIIIPVADRPEHLKECLESLLHLCWYFNYGNFSCGTYQKVTVFIVDDSRDFKNQQKNQDLASSFTQRGLTTKLINSQEQHDIVNLLSEKTKRALTPLIGISHKGDFSHKGPSVTRNIAYLIATSYLKRRDRTLIFFIDSDQEFNTVVQTSHGERKLFAINYFYYLNKIFSQCNIDVLTGKVVGDPPVSPAVMMGNFLSDVCYFFQLIAHADPDKELNLHRNSKDDTKHHQASYHDMAELFGYPLQNNPLLYVDDRSKSYTSGQLFISFSRTIMNFFHGNHPTRHTPYVYSSPFLTMKPARTVYTGNYVLRTDALSFFIPFAELKLRMAGPVLGRLIKAQKTECFVSANLPMLHKRTVGQNNNTGYRPGIEHKQDIIDLCGEFERQYWGDVMLFSIEHLIESVKYPHTNFSYHEILAVVNGIREKMKKIYEKKHDEIVHNINILAGYIRKNTYWWNRLPEYKEAAKEYERFLKNVIHNFGATSDAYQSINSSDKIRSYCEKISHAIVRYPEDMKRWEQALEEIKEI